MIQNSSGGYHEPVLVNEVLRYLNPQPAETMLDATLGGGGHSLAIAQRLIPGGTLIGLDRDADALAAAETRLTSLCEHLTIITIRSDFGKLDTAFQGREETAHLALDGVLFDLGVSSHQLDTARGFSFRRDEPLDMRMDVSSGETAAEMLATIREEDLARIIWEFGEDRFSRRIARAIIERRDRGQLIETTAQLAGLVENAVPRAAWPKDIHVATRTFQAIRIALNDELGQLRAGLNGAVSRLRAGGRIVVISYHSLEDRIVKHAFAEWAGRAPSAPGSSPAAFQEPRNGQPILQLLTKKPVVPEEGESARNPRARSAKMRAAMRFS